MSTIAKRSPLGHWTVVKGLLSIGFAAVAFAAIRDATQVSALAWAGAVHLFLTATSLVAIIRGSRASGCAGFAVFGWALFIPSFWVSTSMPTDRLLDVMVREALRPQRPPPLPAGFHTNEEEDGTIEFYWDSSTRAPLPPELQRRGALATAYDDYNGRARATKRTGSALSVINFGMIGAASGRWLSRRTIVATPSPLSASDPGP